jgi:hypothetical protein
MNYFSPESLPRTKKQIYMLTLITFLKKVNDPSHNLGKRHLLCLILLLVIFGVMFGHLGYRDIAVFALI